MAFSVHPRPDYPFALDLRITYTMSVDGLSVRTTATNVGTRVLPFGAGFHPYFSVGTPLVDAAELRVPSGQMMVANRLARVGSVRNTDQPDGRRARKLANRCGSRVDATGFDVLPEVLTHADVCSTASRQPVLDCTTLEAAVRARAMQPLVVLLVEVLRDVPSTRTMPGVCLIDLDDMKQFCPVDTADRAAEWNASKATKAAGAIQAWLSERASASTIVQFPTRRHQIRPDELHRVATRLRKLSAVESAAVEELSRAHCQQVVPDAYSPIAAARSTANPVFGFKMTAMLCNKYFPGSRGACLVRRPTRSVTLRAQ